MNRTLAATSSGWRVIALGAALAASAAIVTTYRAFNNMYDEPAHLAAGMEWLSKGTYSYEPQHPPLNRVAAAILPWLAGERSKGNSHMYTEGRLILGRGAHYERVLTLARMGELPFFWILLFATWAWGRRVADERTGALAAVFAAANPNLIAHAGVAGIDIGPAALMPAALLAWVMWLEQPDTRRSLLLGTTLALCGLTKFTGVAFWIPAAGATAFLFYRRSSRAAFARTYPKPLAVVLLTGAVIVWATYRFSVGRVGSIVLPAPEFWAGLDDALHRGARGHPAYLLGEVREGGWWYYDLIAFAVKTPVALMVFAIFGSRLKPTDASHPRSYHRALLFGVVSVLLVASLTPVDIGIRFLLPVYPLLAVLAALGLVWAWDRARRASNRFVVAALAAWALADPIVIHPDHIAYFNVFAGPNPERVLVDSNLDWGQDLYRLRDAVRELKMDSLRVHYFGTAEFAAVGLERARRLRPYERATGWVAASETFYAGVWSDTALAWLHRVQPVGRVGHSIRLYYIPQRP